MLPHEFRWVSPNLSSRMDIIGFYKPAPVNQADILSVYRTTHAFYREIHYRQERDRYCAWYRTNAQAHRQELAKMRGDINLLGLFSRGRK